MRLRWIVGFVLLSLLVGWTEAQPDLSGELPRIKPTEAKDAHTTFKLAPGFRIELAASEPAIRSPVAVDFDEDGRMYVAEFPEYNQHGNPNFKERGAIKLLEDTDGDGRYDKVSTFADLDSPVALACWDGGLFVGSVPHIYYLKDTKGTGKADLKEIVYTGFGRDKAGEGMLNSFRWGLDNRFHVSTSAAGGTITRAGVKDAQAYNVRGHGFRFDPLTLKFELVAGSAQHGMSLDDFGRTFTCDNSNPAHLLMYDGRYLTKNPYVQAPAPLVNIHTATRKNYLQRISPNEPWRIVRTRLRLKGEVPGPTETGEVSGHFTGTSGVTAYRGDAFPAAYRNTLFVGEVSNNLVFHAKLEPKGLSLEATRFENGAEFLASTDNWFRPAQFANAPDGTLYVIDHYREIIETIESIPPVILKHLHIGSGIDRGRIWRIRPEGFKRPVTPKLSKATSAELVKLLDHANGWHRDTASRLLYQRQDRSVLKELESLARDAKTPQGRIHALYTLAGLDAYGPAMALVALGDPDARVREHAVRLAERRLDDPSVVAKLHGLVTDPDAHVRYQLAFTLGAVGGEKLVEALHKLAGSDGKDAWMRLAILTSAHSRRGEVFRTFADDKSLRAAPEGVTLLTALAAQIGAANKTNEVADFVATLDRLPPAEGRPLMASLMSKLPPKSRDRITQAGKSGELFKELLADAVRTSGDEKQPVADRAAAVRTLGLGDYDAVKDRFAEFLKVRQPESVQRAALEALGRFDRAEVAGLILAAWPTLSPLVRATATETLFARPAWVHAFLDGVEKGTIKTAEIDPARVKLLQLFADATIRMRAAKLFAGNQLSRRKDVLEAYQKSLTLKGDAKAGKEVFKKNCAACHRSDGVGEQIGAELGALRDRGPDFILLNVLDPNREVLPKFVAYQVTTDAGRVLTGLIQAETATGITLRKPDGSSETILRINIDELRSTGLSYMPEGLEKAITPQEMADLIAHLMAGK